ncbi:hypothetical protein [Mycobacterium paraintracellulare]|uniref:hypothetical protein n=1 Tax=Mycobacterium paraintracellulare TaxID=1138383 RepID=UPI0019288B13|nr:hypothetical protein [Mycobacterium paraintracellulare]BCP15677.1 hypothetical protein MINTM021_25860 [Mycobacterium paraintracellulare]
MSTRRNHRPAQRDTSKVEEAGKVWQEPAPKLASVAKLPSAGKPARKAAPRSLRSAVARGSERDVLVVLRRKLAEQLDAELPSHAVPGVIRQFRDVDAQIRAIDEREAEQAAAQDDDDDQDDDEDTTFDPNSL